MGNRRFLCPAKVVIDVCFRAHPHQEWRRDSPEAEFTAPCHPGMRELFAQCVQPDPADRPSFAEVAERLEVLVAALAVV